MTVKRLSEAETRDRMLARGSSILIEAGPTVGLDAIRMENIIKAAEVSRASAYRVWPSREEFVQDTLVFALSQVTLLPETLKEVEDIAQLFKQNRHELGAEQGRRKLVVEALRSSVDADIRRIIDSPQWRLFLGISVTAQTLENDKLRAAVVAELRRIEAGFVVKRAQIYAQLASLIGYRQRSPWQGERGFETLSAQASLTMRGIFSRALFQPEWLDQRTELALFDAPATLWSEAEIALVSVLLGHLEPDPGIEWTEARIDQAERQFVAIAAELIRKT